jgi:hypothetical protein
VRPRNGPDPFDETGRDGIIIIQACRQQETASATIEQRSLEWLAKRAGMQFDIDVTPAIEKIKIPSGRVLGNGEYQPEIAGRLRPYGGQAVRLKELPTTLEPLDRPNLPTGCHAFYLDGDIRLPATIVTSENEVLHASGFTLPGLDWL